MRETVQLDDRKLKPKQVDEPSHENAATDAGSPSRAPAVDAAGSPPSVDELEQQIVAVLKTCYDPEIPVNIYELGLIYEVHIDEERNASIKMTLTSPMCPVAGSLPPEVQTKVQKVPGLKSAKVDVVWSPPWHQDMMSEAARLQLGLY